MACYLKHLILSKYASITKQRQPGSIDNICSVKNSVSAVLLLYFVMLYSEQILLEETKNTLLQSSVFLIKLFMLLLSLYYQISLHC